MLFNLMYEIIKTGEK